MHEEIMTAHNNKKWRNVSLLQRMIYVALTMVQLVSKHRLCMFFVQGECSVVTYKDYSIGNDPSLNQENVYMFFYCLRDNICSDDGNC